MPGSVGIGVCPDCNLSGEIVISNQGHGVDPKTDQIAWNRQDDDTYHAAGVFSCL